MAGKAARPRPAAALRQAVGDVKDLAGELGALAEGIAVTEAAREVVPLAPPPKGRPRDLGRLRPQGSAPRARRAAVDADAGPASLTRPEPRAPRAAAAPRTAPATHPAPTPAATARGASSPMPAALAPGAATDIFTPPRPALPAHVELVDDVDPTGRPWTVAAAMEPIQGPAIDGTDTGGVTEGERHPWLMTAVVVGAVLVAILVFIGSHLSLGSTPTVGFAVNGLRALHAQDDTGGGSEGHFSSTTASILIEADYIGATPSDTLTLMVERDGTSLTDTSVTLDPADGTAHATLQSSGTSFAPGNYVVSAVWQKRTLRTIAFIVDPPASPAPSPPPAAGPSPGPPTPSPAPTAAGTPTPQPSP